jgi:hypothetical protein
MRFLTRVAPVLALLLMMPLGESSAQTAPAFFGPTPSANRAPANLYQHFAPGRASQNVAAPRALVLEPFGIELDLGVNAGQPEIDALTQAGFQVDVYRESAVTIPVIESMAGYSVVYMESHSGTCGPPLCKKNDVFVLTGVPVPADVNPYRSLFADGSMTEGSPDTHPGNIYLAFTSQLIKQHVGTFADSSIVFINGCDLLANPNFLQVLSAHGASTVYSWNRRVNNFDAEAAADFIFSHLTAGETASAALADARANGLGTSLAEDGATLDLFGDPDNAFAKTLVEATPTVTPTASPTPTGVPTSTSTPTPIPVATRASRVAGKCKKGYKRVKGTCKKVKKKVE